MGNKTKILGIFFRKVSPLLPPPPPPPFFCCIFLYWTNVVYRYNTKTSVAQMSRIFSATAPAQKHVGSGTECIEKLFEKKCRPKEKVQNKSKIRNSILVNSKVGHFLLMILLLTLFGTKDFKPLSGRIKSFSVWSIGRKKEYHQAVSCSTLSPLPIPRTVP